MKSIKKVAKGGLIGCLTCIVVALTAVSVSAATETETAGSSLGKETGSELRGRTSAANEGSWLWDEEEGKWRWQDSDGTYPAYAWRKMDGSWYYLNSKGYWIDDNSHEQGSIKGIDVSVWQGEIDWKAVKDFGVEFAIIRLGYGDKKLDKYYEKNMREADAAGIPVGVYYYSKAVNETEALRDAKFVVDNLKGYKVSYPVAIDMEDKAQEVLAPKALGKIAKAFCDEVQLAGYTPMIYTNENWYKNHIDWSELQGIEKWVARYNVRCDENIPREIWQCSSSGRIDGIKGNVDIDFGYKDYTKYIVPRTEADPVYYRQDSWVKDGRGWWYSYRTGGYPANQWEWISNKWYWFDESGYMATGWIYISGKWYYMDESGAMATGWRYISGKWYYMDESGAMATGWRYISGKWYYMHPGTGCMLEETWLDGRYYLKAGGQMAVSEWVDKGRYYVNGNGEWVPGV